MAKIAFTKLTGAGNDFIVVDARKSGLRKIRRPWPAISRVWCNRRTGIGADGVLVLEPSRKSDALMRVFNPDGSEAQMCGNGARCVALFVSQQGGGNGKPITLQTLAGALLARVQGGRVTIGMTAPKNLRLHLKLSAEGKPLDAGFVDTGVPHLVVFVNNVEKADVRRLGRLLRHHPHFAPKGTNVNFVQPAKASGSHIRVRTYERGVEDETLACGTGVAASAIIYALRNLPKGFSGRQAVAVDVASKERLHVSMDVGKSGNGVRVANVTLEGPASRVFDGVAEWPAKGRV